MAIGAISLASIVLLGKRFVQGNPEGCDAMTTQFGIDREEETGLISGIDEFPVMICPFCSGHTPALWQQLYVHSDELGRVLAATTYRPDILAQIPEDAEGARFVTVMVGWMRCQNENCRQIVVQVIRQDATRASPGVKPTTHSSETWLAVPKIRALPSIDALVSEALKRDYVEAFTILDDSPRMSSVLSRRILADLLKQYARAEQYTLAAKIDAFIQDSQHPSRLRDNLHYLREMGDFSAHTQQDEEQRVIDVTREEAEWTLKVIADLFDYFIVAPTKDERLRQSFDKKLEAAGRKPISKPPGK